MKKFLVMLVGFILFFATGTPAMAQTPTPTPDPCSKDAPLSTPCPVHYDTTNVVIPRSQSWVSALFDSISQLLGQKMTASFDWTGGIRPSGDKYPTAKNLPIYGQQIQQASENDLKLAALQDVTKPDAQPKKFTMTSVECVHDPQTGAIVNQFPSSERIETSGDIPGLTQAIEGSQQLSSYTTGWTQISQDYNLKNVVVSTDNVSCDSPSSGQNIEQTTVDTQNRNSYGTGGQSAISTIITAITAALIAPFQGGYRATLKENADIQGKGLTPWIHYALCLFAGCTPGDVSSVSYDTDANKKQLSDAGGAVAAMYKPAEIDDTYKSDLNAAAPDQQWAITGAGNPTTISQNVLANQTTAGDLSTTGNQGVIATAINYAQARVSAAGDYMNCTLMPADYQNTAVPSGACYTNWATAISCSGTLPNLDQPIKDSSCLFGSGIDNISQYIDVQACVPDGKLPPSMIKIIQIAADTYHVPAALILGTIYHEGAFSRDYYVWTEENVKKWSFCGQEMPHCDKTAMTTAQTPFGFIPAYFYADGGLGTVWNAVTVFDPSRNTKDKVSPCNFLDGIFAVAKTVSIWYSTRNPDMVKNNVTLCYTYTMSDAHTLPSSCSQWDDNRAAESQIGFGGYCPEPGKHTIEPAMPDNDPFIQRALKYFHAFR